MSNAEISAQIKEKNQILLLKTQKDAIISDEIDDLKLQLTKMNQTLKSQKETINSQPNKIKREVNEFKEKYRKTNSELKNVVSLCTDLELTLANKMSNIDWKTHKNKNLKTRGPIAKDISVSKRLGSDMRANSQNPYGSNFPSEYLSSIRHVAYDSDRYKKLGQNERYFEEESKIKEDAVTPSLLNMRRINNEKISTYSKFEIKKHYIPHFKEYKFN